MKQKFRESKLGQKRLAQLQIVNEILESYQDQGYTLTLRQLYYQLVSRDLIANKDSEYKKLGTILADGRMSGLVDWDAIEDRLRVSRRVTVWDDPKQILSAATNGFKYDHLQDQDIWVEVWVEKDALSQIVERAANVYQVPVMVNRGYGSVSAMYNTYKRLRRKLRLGSYDEAVILYLGDFDPSGLIWFEMSNTDCKKCSGMTI